MRNRYGSKRKDAGRLDRVYVQSPDGVVRRLAGYRGSITSAAFVAGQAHVVTVSGHAIHVADSRSSPNFMALRAHVGHLDGATFSPDEGTIFTLGDDGKGRLWDVETGHLRPTLTITDESLSEGPRTYRPKHGAFSPDSKRLVTVNDKGELQVWDVNTGQPRCPVPGRSNNPHDLLHGVSFLVGGEYILAAYSGLGPGNSFLNYLDAKTCRLAGTFNFDKRIMVALFSADGTALITMPLDPAIPTYPTFEWYKQSAGIDWWSLRGLELRNGAPVRLTPLVQIKEPGLVQGFSFDAVRLQTVTQDAMARLLMLGGKLPVRLKGGRATWH